MYTYIPAELIQYTYFQPQISIQCKYTLHTGELNLEQCTLCNTMEDGKYAKETLSVWTRHTTVIIHAMHHEFIQRLKNKLETKIYKDMPTRVIT